MNRESGRPSIRSQTKAIDNSKRNCHNKDRLDNKEQDIDFYMQKSVELCKNSLFIFFFEKIS